MSQTASSVVRKPIDTKVRESRRSNAAPTIMQREPEVLEINTARLTQGDGSGWGGGIATGPLGLSGAQSQSEPNSSEDQVQQPAAIRSRNPRTAAPEDIQGSSSTTAGQSGKHEKAPVRTKRRTCWKCHDSTGCRGRGGAKLCPNPCKDCKQMTCLGRNSKRPTVPCEASRSQGSQPPDIAN